MSARGCSFGIQGELRSWLHSSLTMGLGHTTQNPHLSPHLQNGDNASTYLLRTPGTEEVLLFFSALKVTLSCSGYRGRLDCQALQDMMGKR